MDKLEDLCNGFKRPCALQKRRPADKRERRFYNHRLGSTGHPNQIEVDQEALGVNENTPLLVMNKKKRTLSAKFTAKTIEGVLESEVNLSHGIRNNG